MTVHEADVIDEEVKKGSAKSHSSSDSSGQFFRRASSDLEDD